MTFVTKTSMNIRNIFSITYTESPESSCQHYINQSTLAYRYGIAKLQINSKNLPTATQFNLNSLALKSIFRR